MMTRLFVAMLAGFLCVVSGAGCGPGKSAPESVQSAPSPDDVESVQEATAPAEEDVKPQSSGGDSKGAIAEVERLGGEVLGAPGTPSLPMVKVKLQATETTDDSLAKIVGLESIQILKLNYTRVTDRGLDHLKSLEALEELDLERTGVTDAGVPTLAEMRSLKLLCLKNTKVTKAGIDRLKAALPALRIEE